MNKSTNFTDIFETIKNSKKILITAHRYPDTDAVGSCLALSLILDSINKENKIWLSDIHHDHFKFLPNNNQIERDFPKTFKYDCCIVLDCSDISRVNKSHFIEDATHSFQLINIDHHSDNTYFGDMNIVEKISSVGELIYKHFNTINMTFTKDMATCLYAAISFDTGRFAFSSVTKETLLAAADLVDHGAEPAPLTRALDENRTIRDLELIKVCIDNLVINEEKKYVYSVIPKNAPKGNLKLIDFIRKLHGYEVFIIFQELKPYVTKINLRSKTYFNVSEFSKQFGGGGHIHAAGILIDNSLNDIKDDLLKALDNAL
ncbi:hypothetical protein DID76_02520 [Candidatus Marinamargulisbacteria bacterium SCGC AG-414-C22]|nr:hypothetical protein DID76_02520 [Candidatus Marinamargulisbacteria bacterium SCGC AG-414-C22]